MDIAKFVYDSIVNEAVKGGANEAIARCHADMGKKMFKQSSFIDKTVGKMIERMIKESVKESKMAKSKSKKPDVIPRKAPAKQQAAKKTKPVSKSNFASDKVKNRKINSDCGLLSKKI